MSITFEFTYAETNTIKLGDRKPEVIDLKHYLNHLGFTSFKNPTNYFGVQTENGVKSFQGFYGISVTGIADSETITNLRDLATSPLQKGKRHADTITLKKDLDYLGYKAFKNPTNYFGVQTERLVKDFQKKYNLPVSGIADKRTLLQIQELKNGPMYRGLRRDDVIQLKVDLQKLGFVEFKNPTNYYGVETEAGVKAFQKFYGMKITGQADKVTVTNLRDLITSPLQKGKRHVDTIKLKQDLDYLGYKVFDNPTNYFGVQTEQLVKDFQKKYNLPVSGIADKKTLLQIQELIDGPMFKGLRRDDVIQLKVDLQKLGFVNFKNPTNYYGVETEAGVKAFQTYFSINASGIADSVTVQKLQSIVNTPLQKGKRHKDTIKLKFDLEKLGYEAFKNPTNYYGVQTEALVKQFQKDHGLVINGIADEVTLKKISELIKEIEDSKPDPEPDPKPDPEEPKEPITYTNYDVTFNEALNIQMDQLQQTDKYKNEPAYVAAEYIVLSGNGVIYSTGNVNLRTSPKLGDNKNVKFTVPNGTVIEILGEESGDSHSGSTKWYRIKYKGETLYVHSSLANPNGNTGRVTASTLNVRSKPGTDGHVYGQLKEGEEVTIVKKEGDNWYQIQYLTWRNPTRADVEQYLNPNNNDEFQHLLLSSSVGVSADELNKVLKGKRILEGKGQAFINGAKKHKVNEIYLISHAFLETGNGKSDLANGIEVGVDKKGNLVLVTNNNRKDLKKIKKTYNMFGIGAADSDPLRLGAIYAYEQGWITPEKAIEGGAEFVGKRYIHNNYKQNTLYKMRWNPANPGYPQYATDIGWASKQASIIKDLYDLLENPTLHFDIPVYK